MHIDLLKHNGLVTHNDLMAHNDLTHHYLMAHIAPKAGNVPGTNNDFKAEIGLGTH